MIERSRKGSPRSWGLVLGLGLLGPGELTACRPPCGDVEGACLALYLDGDGNYSQLEATATLTSEGGTEPSWQCQLSAFSEGPLSLPTWVQIVPPPVDLAASAGCSDSDVSRIRRLGFTGRRPADPDGTRVSFHPLAALEWASGSHIERTFRLVPIDSDTGAADSR